MSSAQNISCVHLVDKRKYSQNHNLITLFLKPLFNFVARVPIQARTIASDPSIKIDSE